MMPERLPPPVPPRRIKSPGELAQVDSDRRAVEEKNRQAVENVTAYFQEKGLSDTEQIAPTEDGRGVIVTKKYLYHGTTIPAIKSFMEAENATIGNGVYLTDARSAAQYANVRAGSSLETPRVVYETLLENKRIFDLRDQNNVQYILGKFSQALYEAHSNTQEWALRRKLGELLVEAASGMVHRGNLKKAFMGAGNLVRKVIESEGYDGLIAFEGGEGGQGFDHESWVVFDPQKLPITDEKES